MELFSVLGVFYYFFSLLTFQPFVHYFTQRKWYLQETMDWRIEVSHCRSDDQPSNRILFKPGLTTLEGWVEPVPPYTCNSFPACSVPRHTDWAALVQVLLKRGLHLLFPLTWACRNNCWVLILVGPDQLGIMEKCFFVKVGIIRILQLGKML